MTQFSKGDISKDLCVGQNVHKTVVLDFHKFTIHMCQPHAVGSSSELCWFIVTQSTIKGKGKRKYVCYSRAEKNPSEPDQLNRSTFLHIL